MAKLANAHASLLLLTARTGRMALPECLSDSRFRVLMLILFLEVASQPAGHAAARLAHAALCGGEERQRARHRDGWVGKRVPGAVGARRQSRQHHKAVKRTI